MHRLLLAAALGMGAFASAGVAAGQSAPAQGGSALASSVVRLLDAAEGPPKTQASEAERRYRECLAVAPGDARVEYAYSLVLQRLFKSSEAKAHLDRSLKLNPTFSQARQASIRDAIKARRFPEAQEQLSRFAVCLATRRSAETDDGEWMGRIVGSVIHAVGNDDAKESFSYQDRLLRTSLPPMTLAAYERGFASIEAELNELTELINQAQSGAETRRETTKAEVDARLNDQQKDIKQKQQDATKTRQKWDEWIADQTGKADDLLREQEKRFLDLDRAATSQVSIVAALRLQLDRIDRNLTPLTRPGFNTPLTSRERIELSLAAEERKLQMIYSQQESVTQQGAQTIATRKAAVAQYQQATGVALKEASNLDRWEKRNKTIAENMKKAAEKKPAQVASLEAKIKSLNTWDPTDFESEKRRLLADLGVTPKEDSPAATKLKSTKH